MKKYSMKIECENTVWKYSMKIQYENTVYFNTVYFNRVVHRVWNYENIVWV